MTSHPIDQHPGDEAEVDIDAHAGAFGRALRDDVEQGLGIARGAGRLDAAVNAALAMAPRGHGFVPRWGLAPPRLTWVAAGVLLLASGAFAAYWSQPRGGVDAEPGPSAATKGVATRSVTTPTAPVVERLGPAIGSASDTESTTRAAPAPAEAPPREPGPDTGPRRGARAALSDVEDAGTLFARANDARRAGRYAVASAAYDRLLARFPATREADVASVTLGRLLLDRSERAARALALFDGYLARQPAGPLSEQALAGRAQALGRLGRTREEVRAWRELLARFPDSTHAAHARNRIAPAK